MNFQALFSVEGTEHKEQPFFFFFWFSVLGFLFSFNSLCLHSVWELRDTETTNKETSKYVACYRQEQESVWKYWVRRGEVFFTSGGI